MEPARARNDGNDLPDQARPDQVHGLAEHRAHGAPKAKSTIAKPCVTVQRTHGLHASMFNNSGITNSPIRATNQRNPPPLKRRPPEGENVIRRPMGEMPMVPISRPKAPPSSPFSTDPVDSVPISVSPRMATQNISEGPNFSASCAKGGAASNKNNHAHQTAHDRGNGGKADRFQCAALLWP